MLKWIRMLPVLLALLLLIGLRPAIAFTTLVTTDWTTGTVGSNSAGSAGTTTGAGAPWIDVAGSVASAGSQNVLNMAVGSSPQSNNQVVVLPASLGVRDEQNVVEFPWNSTANAADHYVVLRWQGSNTCYLVGESGTTISIYKLVSGSFTALSTVSMTTTPTNGDRLRITAFASGASPTTISEAVFDVTTSTTLHTTITTTDSTAALQIAGPCGFYVSKTGGGSVTWYSGIASNISTQSMTDTPTPGSPTTGNSISNALTGTSTAWSSGTPGTPAFLIYPSTYTSLSQTVGSTTAATVVFTPTAAATYYISDPNGPTATVTVIPGPTTTYTISGATTIQQGVGSVYTYQPNGAFTGTITPSVSGVTGSFSPSTLTWSSSSVGMTTIFTATSNGAATLSGTNNGSITDGTLSITVTPPNTILSVAGGALSFSPGNWTGDTGRGGSVYRRTWNAGAYFSAYWTAPSGSHTLLLDLTNGTSGSTISYNLNGTFVDNVSVPSSGNISISGAATGANTLTVYCRQSQQINRWNYTNAWTLTGVEVDPGSTPGTAPALTNWILIIGDSITEGILAGGSSDTNIADYSHLIGESLKTSLGWDYGISACGGSGWLRTGDSTADVPGYYVITGSSGGTGGTYNDAASRWNKLDGSNSLLDSNSHISAFGATGTEPAAILVNYITNESINSSNTSDTQASVQQGIAALRNAAPNAWIFVLVPIGLYNTTIFVRGTTYIPLLKAGFNAYQTATPDAKCILLDYGAGPSNLLASSLYGAAIHPNTMGHSYMSALVNPSIRKYIDPTGSAAAGSRQIKRGR